MSDSYNTPNDSLISNITVKRKESLPKIDTRALQLIKHKQYQNLNFNVMLGLPVSQWLSFVYS